MSEVVCASCISWPVLPILAVRHHRGGVKAVSDLAFGPLANTCHNLFHFQQQEATTHQPSTMCAILGSFGVCEVGCWEGGRASYKPESCQGLLR